MRNAGTQVTNSSVQVWAAPSCICMHTSTSETKENIPEDPNGEVSYISRMCHLQQKKKSHFLVLLEYQELSNLVKPMV